MLLKREIVQNVSPMFGLIIENKFNDNHRAYAYFIKATIRTMVEKLYCIRRYITIRNNFNDMSKMHFLIFFSS